jgi:hypothetical protein
MASKKRIITDISRGFSEISDINNVKTFNDIIEFTKSMITIHYKNKAIYSNGKWLILNIDNEWIESTSSNYVKIMCNNIRHMIMCKLISYGSPIDKTKKIYDVITMLNMDYFFNTIREDCEHLFYKQ